MWAWAAPSSPVAPRRRGGQAGVQYGGVDPAAVADAGQPGGEPAGREPVGPVLAVEAGQERQADGAVEVGEQADGTGEEPRRWARSWLASATRWATRSLRARQVARSADGGGAVWDQRPQPGPVGAQRVGEDEGVEPVVLVARRAVAARRRFLTWFGLMTTTVMAGLEQGVDDRPVRRSIATSPAPASPAGGPGPDRPGGGVLDA